MIPLPWSCHAFILLRPHAFWKFLCGNLQNRLHILEKVAIIGVARKARRRNGMADMIVEQPDWIEHEARAKLVGMVGRDRSGLAVEARDWRDALAALHVWASNAALSELNELGIIEFEVWGVKVVANERHVLVGPVWDPFSGDEYEESVGYTGNVHLTLEGGRGAFETLVEAWRSALDGRRGSVMFWPGTRSWSMDADFDLGTAYEAFLAEFEEDQA